MQPRPIQAIDQRRELRGGEPHHAVADRRPAERTLLQPLPEQHQSGPVPSQNLEAVRSFRTEDEDRSREWIMPQLFLHQRGKTVTHCKGCTPRQILSNLKTSPISTILFPPGQHRGSDRAAAETCAGLFFEGASGGVWEDQRRRPSGAEKFNSAGATEASVDYCPTVPSHTICFWNCKPDRILACRGQRLLQTGCPKRLTNVVHGSVAGNRVCSIPHHWRTR
jgi:hypothetical protein